MTDPYTTLTPAEIRIEREYRTQERLGLLCGSATPTPEQMAIAVREADEWEARFLGLPMEI